MQWILLFLGSIIAFSIHQSLTYILIGAIAGLLVGHNIRIRRLINEKKQLAIMLEKIKKESQHFQQTTSHQLTLINKQLFQQKNTSENDGSSPQQTTETLNTVSIIQDKELITPTINEQKSEEKPFTSPNNIQITKPLQSTYLKQDNGLITQPTITKADVPNINHDIVDEKPEPKPTPFHRPIPTPSPNIPLKQKAFTSPLTEETADSSTENDFLSKVIMLSRQWLFGGNTILKIGAIILFLGLAFLLRYATEGMTFPIEARYLGVAIAGFIMIALGWKLRHKENNYGLILQGVGIATLYLTSYTAMYLHQLLSPNSVFVILLIITACSALLAILEDAVSLAMAASLGGFAAPALVSSSGGNHVALFIYFILLNTGILSIAWFKTWRPLNLIGLIGTFGIGFAWGIRSYTPDLFWSTEPFLILFFIMYITIGLLFTRRKLYDAKQVPDNRQALLHWSIRQVDYIDAAVVFGTPIIAFGLQYGLIAHMPYGAAISALVLGLFYLSQAVIFHLFGSKRITLLIEICLAFGVIFTSLSIPLAFDVDLTSATWAIEGAGILWISLRQHRNIGRAFAILLQFAAAISYLMQLTKGNESLIQGSLFGAFILGIALLFSFYQITKHQEQLSKTEQELPSLLAISGASFIYLLAPLQFMALGTTVCWIAGGLITLFITTKIYSKALTNYGLLIQFIACLLFFTTLSTREIGIGFNSNTFQFIICLIIGLLLFCNSFFLSKKHNNFIDSSIISIINMLLLFGLIISHCGLLYILPWLWVAGAWAISSVITLFIARRFNLILPFYFSFLLQGIAGLIVISHYLTSMNLVSPLFINIYFITPFTISLTSLLIGWLTYNNTTLDLSDEMTKRLSQLALLWGVIWWATAFIIELNQITSYDERITLLLFTLAISLLIIGVLARLSQWADLALPTMLLIPLAAALLYNNILTPFSHYGWAAWCSVFIVHFINLKQLDTLLPNQTQSLTHIIGLWLLITVLSCGLYEMVNSTGTTDETWYWLVWMIAPTAWLLMINSKISHFWPIRAFDEEYRLTASLPLAIAMFGWFWIANTFSTGEITQIPYIPLLNPLEIALLASLASSIWWFYKQKPTFSPRFFQAILGVSLFALSTAIVFRAAYHWANIPYHFEDQMQSMLVQASLSILWTTVALALMIIGHKKVYRELWITGAILISIVVVKLFFIELSNSGSLARIISFTIVGILLLIVGYFAPLPPKKDKQQPIT